MEYAGSQNLNGKYDSCSDQEQGCLPYHRSIYLKLTDTLRYSFSLKTGTSKAMGAEGHTLFWTSAWNILSLLPSQHVGGNSNGKLLLIAFARDDFPSAWHYEVDVGESKLFDI